MHTDYSELATPDTYLRLKELVSSVDAYITAQTDGVLQPTLPEDYDHKVMVAFQKLECELIQSRQVIDRLSPKAQSPLEFVTNDIQEILSKNRVLLGDIP